MFYLFSSTLQTCGRSDEPRRSDGRLSKAKEKKDCNFYSFRHRLMNLVIHLFATVLGRPTIWPAFRSSWTNIARTETPKVRPEQALKTVEDITEIIYFDAARKFTFSAYAKVFFDLIFFAGELVVRNLIYYCVLCQTL